MGAAQGGVVLLCVMLCILKPVSGTRCPLIEAPRASADQKTGSYMVVMKDSINESSWQDLKVTLQTLSRDSHVSCTVQNLVKMITVTLTEENLNRVRSLPEVEYVEEETRVKGMQEDVPWHVDRLDQPRLPLNNRFLPVSLGEGVDVYVLDTGIVYSHEDFEGRAKYSGYDPMDVYRRESRRGLDCHGHGTQVASVVAGRSSGMARKARVYSVRVLDCSNTGVWSVVMAGLDYISQLVAPMNRPVVVVLAFNGPFSQTVEVGLHQLYNTGIFAVSSAGNDGSDACSFTPSRSVYVLTAGGTSRGDNFYESSNYGSCVDILAPATQVRGADWQCTTCYKTANGTSSSAALSAGVAAIILSQEPLLHPSDLKGRVVASAVRDVLNLPVHVRARTPNLLLQVPGGCGGHYLAPVVISSPNHPRNYPDNLLEPCKWSIIADAVMETQVQCNVTSFVTEANYDQVSVCDGLICCEASSWDQLSGTIETHPSYTSTTGALTVELLTDDSNNYQGFTFLCQPVGGSSATVTTVTTPPLSTTQTMPVTSNLLTSDPFIMTAGTVSPTDSVTSSPPTSTPTSPVTLDPETTPLTTETTLLTSNPDTLMTSDPEISPPTSDPTTSDPGTLPVPPTLSPGVVINETVEVDEMASLVASVISDVVEEVVILLQDLVAQSMNSSLSSKLQGRLQQYPEVSCHQLAVSTSVLSGYYWMKSGNGSAVRVFCDVSSSFGVGGRGYMRVADLDMSRASEVCPDTLQARTDICDRKLCGRGNTLPGCSSVNYPTFGIPFQRVCGQVLAFQYGTPNGFFAHQYNPAITIDEAYLDGVSMTYGYSPRRHIWSFAAAMNSSTGGPSTCPCMKSDASQPSVSIPVFVEQQYFCDTSSLDNSAPGYCNEQLWDGRGCGYGNSCCSMQGHSPWFCLDLGEEVVADIELRVCGNENSSNEDSPLQAVSLYVQ